MKSHIATVYLASDLLLWLMALIFLDLSMFCLRMRTKMRMLTVARKVMGTIPVVTSLVQWT